MKIVEINAENNGKVGGRKELGAAEKWLFDTEDGEIRLKTLMNMTAGQQGIAELGKNSKLMEAMQKKAMGWTFH